MCEALQMCSLNWMLIIIEHTLPLSFSLISAGLFILFWQQYVGSRPASTHTQHTHHHAFLFDQYHRTRSSPAPVSKVPKWAGWETSRLLASRSISQAEAENMKPLEPRWNAQRQSRSLDRLEGSLAPRWLPVPGGFTRQVFSYDAVHSACVWGPRLHSATACYSLAGSGLTGPSIIDKMIFLLS